MQQPLDTGFPMLYNKTKSSAAGRDALLDKKITDSLIFFYQKNEAVCADANHYPHTHSFCELYFYLGGRCSYMIEEGVYQLSYGTVIFTRPGELHSVMINEACTYERAYYQIHPHALDYLGAGSAMRCFLERPFGQENTLILERPLMDDCLSRILRTDGRFLNGDPDRNMLAMADFLEILHTVNRAFDERTGSLCNVPKNELVNRALRYINLHLPELTTVADLADRLFVSREYLSRLFSEAMGITLIRYITRKRIEMAKSLLAQGKSLEEVCSACGWQDYSYFISVFRRETGITPLKFQQTNRLLTQGIEI